MTTEKLEHKRAKSNIVKPHVSRRKKMLIEVWHEDHDHKEIITFVPQIGSLLHFDDESEFVKASGFHGYEVVRVSYWLNEKSYNDECAVIVKNAKGK